MRWREKGFYYKVEFPVVKYFIRIGPEHRRIASSVRTTPSEGACVVVLEPKVCVCVNVCECFSSATKQYTIHVHSFVRVTSV